MDAILKFIAQTIQRSNNYKDYITVQKLYEIYNQWCIDHNERNTSLICFVRELKKLGLTNKQYREPNTWKHQNAVHVFQFITLVPTVASVSVTEVTPVTDSTIKGELESNTKTSFIASNEKKPIDSKCGDFGDCGDGTVNTEACA